MILQRRKTRFFLVLLPFWIVTAYSDHPQSFSWFYDGEEFSLEFDANDYSWCMGEYGKRRHNWENPGKKFISDDPCRNSMGLVSGWLKERTDSKGYDRLNAVNMALNFVKSLHYWEPADKDYVRYPYEMLLGNTGTCVDFALLFASILSHWCLNSVLIERGSHLAVAVDENNFRAACSGSYYNHNGKRFFYCETVGCRPGKNCGEVKVGEMPPLAKNVSTAAQNIIPVPLLCSHRLSTNLPSEPDDQFGSDDFFGQSSTEGRFSLGSPTMKVSEPRASFEPPGDPAQESKVYVLPFECKGKLWSVD